MGKSGMVLFSRLWQSALQWQGSEASQSLLENLKSHLQESQLVPEVSVCSLSFHEIAVSVLFLYICFLASTPPYIVISSI